MMAVASERGNSSDMERVGAGVVTGLVVSEMLELFKTTSSLLEASTVGEPQLNRMNGSKENSVRGDFMMCFG
jgi:hypothetical protein